MFGDLSPHYHPLTPQTVGDYVRSRSELSTIFYPSDEIEAVEVGDGNLNLVFKVWAKADPKRTVPFLMKIRAAAPRLVLRTACETLPEALRKRVLA